MSRSILFQLLIPQTNTFKRLFRVRRLVCITPDFDDLKKEMEITDSETDPHERQILIAQINAYAVKIYNLDMEELEYVLSTFPIVEADDKMKVMAEFEQLCDH
jgi:hypothetical protein